MRAYPTITLMLAESLSVEPSEASFLLIQTKSLVLND